MFKKWQPGFPCNTLVLGNVFSLSSCIKIRLGGFANDSCSCCTDFNGYVQYQGVYGTGRLLTPDTSECSSYGLLTFLYGPNFSFVCGCVGSVPSGGLQSEVWLEFEEFCEHVRFTVHVGGGSACSLTFGWGAWPLDTWADPGADDEAARNAIRQLAGGQTVRIPIDASISSWSVCDISGAYVDVSLVPITDCGSTPTNIGCSSSAQSVNNCAFAPPTLTVGGFDDCSAVSPTTYLSRLNRTYTCHRVMISEDATPGCTFEAGGVSNVLFQSGFATQGEYGDGIPDGSGLGDPGILLKATGPRDTDRTEVWAYAVGFGCDCSAGEAGLRINLFYVYTHTFEVDSSNVASFSRSDCYFWTADTSDAVSVGPSPIANCTCQNTMQTIFWTGNVISPCEAEAGTNPSGDTFTVSTILVPPIQ